jgi:uncharacterized membrane protein YeaQ/YmgE (transglycosylase-associated protein family)
MGILGWIILGGLAGWLASRVVRGSGFGLLGDIVVGIVGGIIGGFIIGVLGGTGITGFNLWSFVVAVLGAVLLLLIVRFFNGSRTSIRR